MILNMKLTHVWCWICQTCQNANNQFILAGFCSLSQGISSQEGVSPSARPRNSFNIPSHQCWRFLWVESLPPRCSMGKYDIVRWSKAVFSLIASDQRQYDNANRISLKISSLSFFGCFLHWRRRIAWYSFMSIMNFFVNLGSSPSSSNFCPNKKISSWERSHIPYRLALVSWWCSFSQGGMCIRFNPHRSQWNKNITATLPPITVENKYPGTICRELTWKIIKKNNAF